MSMCGPPRKGAWPAAEEVPPAGWWSNEGGDGVDRAGESWWWWCGGGGSWAFEYLGFVEQPGEYWGPRGRAPPAAPDTDPDPRPMPTPTPWSCWWCGGKYCWWRCRGSGEVGRIPAAAWAA